MDETRLRTFLERFGKALTSGDAEGIKDCWEVPALVLSDEGSVAVSALSQVATFFAGAALAGWRVQRLMFLSAEAAAGGGNFRIGLGTAAVVAARMYETLPPRTR